MSGMVYTVWSAVPNWDISWKFHCELFRLAGLETPEVELFRRNGEKYFAEKEKAHQIFFRQTNLHIFVIWTLFCWDCLRISADSSSINVQKHIHIVVLHYGSSNYSWIERKKCVSRQEYIFFNISQKGSPKSKTVDILPAAGSPS